VKFWLPASAFVSAFFVHFVMHEFPFLPTRFRYLPELAIALCAVVAIPRLVALRRFGLVPLRYWMVFFLFTYVVVSAAIINHVSSEVTFAGIRFYYRYVPLFLLPFAFDYAPRDVKRLFMLLIALMLIQLPVAFHQRFVEYAFDPQNGDVISGTLSLSTSLSLLSVGMITMVVALYISRHIGFKLAAALSLLFLLPATINETKVTPIALGIGVVAVLVARRQHLKVGQIAVMSLMGVLLLGVFVGVYDRMYASRTGTAGYLEFITSKEQVLDNYSVRGVNAKKLHLSDKQNPLVAKPVRLTEQAKWIGRLDGVKMPFDVLLAQDASRFLLGLGIGSVSSDFGEGGRYRYLNRELAATGTTITQLMWETGLLGALLGIMLVSLFIRDAWVRSRIEDGTGDFGAGWFGIACVVLCTLPYANYIGVPEPTYLIAFFSGVVVRSLAKVTAREQKQTDARSDFVPLAQIRS